jgi:hypothetical protein
MSEMDQAKFEHLNKKMIDVRPWILKYLVELGVVESYAKTFTVRRAYEVLHKLLRKRLKRKKVETAYWLWTHGIPLDTIVKMKRKEIDQILKMIWSNKKNNQT